MFVKLICEWKVDLVGSESSIMVLSRVVSNGCGQCPLFIYAQQATVVNMGKYFSQLVFSSHTPCITILLTYELTHVHCIKTASEALVKCHALQQLQRNC